MCPLGSDEKAAIQTRQAKALKEHQDSAAAAVEVIRAYGERLISGLVSELKDDPFDNRYKDKLTAQLKKLSEAATTAQKQLMPGVSRSGELAELCLFVENKLTSIAEWRKKTLLEINALVKQGNTYLLKLKRETEADKSELMTKAYHAKRNQLIAEPGTLSSEYARLIEYVKSLETQLRKAKEADEAKPESDESRIPLGHQKPSSWVDSLVAFFKKPSAGAGESDEEYLNRRVTICNDGL